MKTTAAQITVGDTLCVTVERSAIYDEPGRAPAGRVSVKRMSVVSGPSRGAFVLKDIATGRLYRLSQGGTLFAGGARPVRYHVVTMERAA